MYDERSIATNETIGGKKAEEFTREFLEDLNKTYNNSINKNSQTQNTNNVKNGVYMGELENGNTMNYTKLIDSVFKSTEDYFTKFTTTYNKVYTKYGKDITTMLLKGDYRPINKYDVYTSTSPTPGKTLTLFGLHKKTQELNVYTAGLKTALATFVNNSSSTYLVDMLSFNKEMTGSLLTDTNEKILKKFITEKIIENKINELTDSTALLSDLEKSRNQLITSLDKVNFVIKNGKDSTVSDGVVKSVTMSGFTSDLLYNEYETCISYIDTNTSKLFEGLSTNITFLNPTIQSADFDFLMKELLSDSVDILMSEFKDTTLYSNGLKNQLKKRLEKFVEKPKEKNFKLSKFKSRKSGKDIKFGIASTADETNSTVISEANQTFSTSNSVDDKLNFYRAE